MAPESDPYMSENIQPSLTVAFLWYMCNIYAYLYTCAIVGMTKAFTLKPASESQIHEIMPNICWYSESRQ